ncbi:MAG TPA: hypothetical protein VFY27_01470, partial [Woeseiaceae bacterium]|nr:hypothetical protein [Woeseiaceae bacterium]
RSMRRCLEGGSLPMHRYALSLLPALVLVSLLLPVSAARGAEAPPEPATAAMPPPPAWLEELDTLYDARVRVTGLDDRAFSPEHWWDVAGPLATTERGFHTEQVGRSVEGRPLRHVSWGGGNTPVLLWSQMHGDESTASMAIADLFRFLGENPQHPIVQHTSGAVSISACARRLLNLALDHARDVASSAAAGPSAISPP